MHSIRDVAERSGFSVATVSRVLSGSYPVKKKTRERILKAAEELNYVPNMLARSLKTNSSNELALIIPSVTNLFYSSIVTGIEQMLRGRGYSLLIYVIADNADLHEVLNNIRGRRIAGLIVAADCLTEEIVPYIRALRENEVPVVAVDFKPEISLTLPGVYFDYREGARCGASYLTDLGHRRIAYLTMSLDRLSRRMRHKGFCDGLIAAGITPSDDDVFVSDNRNGFEAGVELVDMMLRSGRSYTAVMVNNDAVAVGVLNGLIQRGIRVPEQISVIGFDDSVFAQMAYPKLTTVRVDGEKIGEKACEYVLQTEPETAEERSVYFTAQVIERESTSRING